MTYRTVLIALALGIIVGGAYVAGRHMQGSEEAQTGVEEPLDTAEASTTDNTAPTTSPSGHQVIPTAKPSTFDITPHVTVESVSGLQVRISYANLSIGTDLRIIGVMTPPSALPVTSKTLQPFAGSYSGNAVWEQGTDRISTTLNVTLPANTEYGSYVLEVSDPSDGWRTFIRTPSFRVGADQPVQKPTCWMTATPTTVEAGDVFTLRWGSTGAEYALAPSGAKVPPQQEQKVGTSVRETFSEKLRFVGRGGEVSCSVTVDVR